MNTTLGKSLVGTVAAGAMVASVPGAALARDNGGGVDAATVIAGALVVGGIAALAASSNNDRNASYSRDDRYHDGRDGRGYYGRDRRYRAVSAREAVDQCVAAATRSARRHAYAGGRARVTRISDVDRKDYGFKVEGRIAVEQRARWGRDDTGRFTCRVNRAGGIRNLGFSGIAGL
ncbi:hypothetical protein MTR62_12070 [Novosphingobium sp. 1949]|uniref:17 kDa surface antigen n=2 Tax=Novosphingobium organovorum TaxID=2930092 RepID=A0ABT0BF69_9SPHN|nr:hypothetical protein [Novosphingobium organovorum]